MSATSATLQIGPKISAVVGSEHVCDDPARLTPFAVDGVRPSSWVMPGSAEEVAAILQFANEQRLSVVACGGFTAQSLGGIPPSADILLRTDRLNQVLHYDPGDLTIGVQAGTRVAQVQRTVMESGLMLPLDVPRASQATIGGTLATASAGPLKHGYGGVREYCIGVSFVTGDGRIAKAGGRVVKNVAGYDLMKLLIGSQGTLGVIVSANFKLFTAPRQTRTFLAGFGDVRLALDYCRTIRRSVLAPMCMEIISPVAHRYLGVHAANQWMIAIRAGGSDPVLARYRRELGTSVSDELEGSGEQTFWQGLQEFSQTVIGQHHNALSMRLHLPPAELGESLSAADRIATDNNFLFSCVGRAAVASMDSALIPITVDPPSVTQYVSAVSAIRAALPRDASGIVHRCPREVKSHINVWGTSTNDLDAMRAVKHALDPNDVLNRGRFLF